MSASDLDEFLVHTVTVETWQGTTATGVEQYAAAVTIPCYLESARKLVAVGDGEHVRFATTLYAHPQHGPVFQPRSRVHIDDHPTPGRVVEVNVNTLTADFPEHVEVHIE